MKVGIYSVYDASSGKFAPPIFQHNDDVCKRTFVEACWQRDIPLYMSAQDFQVMRIASFDDETGVIETQQPKTVFTMMEIKQRVDANYATLDMMSESMKRDPAFIATIEKTGDELNA